MSINLVPCLQWVRRGVAKEVPDKVTLTPEELEKVIKEAKERYQVRKADKERNGATNEDQVAASSSDAANGSKKESKKDEQNDRSEEAGDENEDDIAKRYKLDEIDDDDDDDEYEDIEDEEDEEADEDNDVDTDDEDGEENGRARKRRRTAYTTDVGLDFANLAAFASNVEDPYLDPNDHEDSEEELEDDKIQPDDNLLLVGRVETEACALEIHIYNHNEDDFYPHHDILLPAFPVAVQWLDYSSTKTENVNYAAIGDMRGEITIWDLDVIDGLEPMAQLLGHKDSVLSLSWEKISRTLLASGSVDKTVRLWDLQTCQQRGKLKHFKEKIQTLAFHPTRGSEQLLGGDCRGNLAVIDCRTNLKPSLAFQTLQTHEIEKVVWHENYEHQFLASTDSGEVYCYDIRTISSNEKKPIPQYQIHAHDDAVSGLGFIPSLKGCLITAGGDKVVKVWDVGQDENTAHFVAEIPIKVGAILSFAVNPDIPHVVALGGDARANNLRILDLSSDASVCSHFGLKERREEKKNKKNRKDKTSDEADEQNDSNSTLQERN